MVYIVSNTPTQDSIPTMEILAVIDLFLFLNRNDSLNFYCLWTLIKEFNFQHSKRVI